MTPDEIEMVRRSAVTLEATGDARAADLAKVYRALLTEIDRLRSLPVIATCGACPAFAVSELSGEECGHMSLDLGTLHRVDAAKAPPSWCPLRGGR